MKLHYYPDTGSLYIEFNVAPSTETLETADGLNADGRPVRFVIDHASTKLDLATLKTNALPFHSIMAA